MFKSNVNDFCGIFSISAKGNTFISGNYIF